MYQLVRYMYDMVNISAENIYLRQRYGNRVVNPSLLRTLTDYQHMAAGRPLQLEGPGKRRGEGVARIW